MNEILMKVITVLSVYGYRAADYNGGGVWRILGEIVKDGAFPDLSAFYYCSSEKEKWDFVRLFDQWRKGVLL